MSLRGGTELNLQQPLYTTTRSELEVNQVYTRTNETRLKAVRDAKMTIASISVKLGDFYQ